MRWVLAERHRFLTTLLVWAGCFGACLVWLWATPLWTAPDSPAHVMRALSVGSGELVAKPGPATDAGAYTAYTTVPRAVLDSASSAGCTAFQPTVPAACLAPVTDAEGTARFVNPAGQNNPAYYLAVGWATSLLHPDAAVLAAHVLAALWASLFLAWGITAALWSRRPAVTTTVVLLTATPSVLYFAAAVNPNGLEIAAAIGMTASAMTLLHRPEDLGRTMLRRASIAASAMVLSRVMAPLWVIVLAVAFAALAGPTVWRQLRQRRSWVWLALPVVAGLVSVAWTRATGFLSAVQTDYADNSWWTNIGLARQRIEPGAWREQLGTFGWLDTAGPSNIEYTLYAGALFVVVILALLVATRREAVTLLLLLGAAYALPVLLQASQWNHLGPVWQGRYSLPVTVIPLIVAGYAIAGRPVLPARYPAALGSAAAVAAVFHLWMLKTLLHRNVAGTSSPSAFDGPWEPFGSAELVMTLYVLVVLGALTASSTMLWRMKRELTPTASDTRSAVPEPPAANVDRGAAPALQRQQR